MLALDASYASPGDQSHAPAAPRPRPGAVHGPDDFDTALPAGIIADFEG